LTEGTGLFSNSTDKKCGNRAKLGDGYLYNIATNLPDRVYINKIKVSGGARETIKVLIKER